MIITNKNFEKNDVVSMFINGSRLEIEDEIKYGGVIYR